MRIVLRSFVSFNTIFILSVLCLILLFFYKPALNFRINYQSETDYGYLDNNYGLSESSALFYHKEIVDVYYKQRKNLITSNLGAILFKNITHKSFKHIKSEQNRTYQVLIWKYWNWLENRHVNNFNKKRTNDPLSDCSVKNCKYTGNDDMLDSVDAVVVHIQRALFPITKRRNIKQRWIFLSDESPIHAFSMAKTKPNISEMAFVFNWSMTYRSDSDVPVPYGRTIPLQKPILSEITTDSLSILVPYWKTKRKDVLVNILISNCGVSARMNFLHSLEEYLSVDVYGKCSKNHKDACPGHFRSDCKLMSEYLFYLVFENSECEEYLTEKSFYHAYSKGAIPVIMGPTVENCQKLLPPDSFLHVDNYESAESLANHMIHISQDDALILGYHQWRNDFAVLNEHGYFGSKSYHLCRICEALNYNDPKEKTYDKEQLRLFFDPLVACRD